MSSSGRSCVAHEAALADSMGGAPTNTSFSSAVDSRQVTRGRYSASTGQRRSMRSCTLRKQLLLPLCEHSRSSRV